MNHEPDPNSARRRMANEQWASRRRDLKWLAREVAEEILLDVPVRNIRAVAEALDIEEPNETEINGILISIRHAEVRPHISEASA